MPACRPADKSQRAFWTFTLLAGCIGLAPLHLSAADRIDFDRDIRPILSDNCFQCHGPDEANRQADLRLDRREGLFADRDGKPAVVPGDPVHSEIVRRITAGEEERMPPVDSGRKLTESQIEKIRLWIEQGAAWEQHWAFVPPVAVPLPQVANPDWPRNGIDHFILARLEAEGLTPSPEADKAALARRVTLDLTGLPPEPEDLDAFLADDAPDAYEQLVDRLLASPRYGERMAVGWLDAARYADTSGYQSDGPRDMWRWRDWVIEALNANMPFDRFTLEQLAGDMLPNATLQQRIATGFNRNHRGNAEGGIIPEEYAVEYVVDRVDTTFTVWLGLTMGCARCHDHKFDPITQREFYQVFAYFNNVPEYGRAIKEGNSPPFIKAPTPAQQAHQEHLQRQVAEAENHVEQLEPELAAAQAEWEKTRAAREAEGWAYSDRLLAHFPLDIDGAEFKQRVPARAFRDGNGAFQPGRLGQAAQFDGTTFFDAGNVGAFGYFDKFSLAAWILPDSDAGGTIVSRMVDAPRADGYSVELHEGRIHVNLVKRWLDDAIRVQTETTVAPGEWHHVLVVYDGSRLASGIRVYFDGEPQPLHVNLDAINQSFKSDEPLRVGGGGGPTARFHGRIDDVRVYGKALSADEVPLVAVPDTAAEILNTPPGERTAAQAQKLRAIFLEAAAPPHIQTAHARLKSLRAELASFVESIPTVMVMQEMETPRPTHVLVRGQYDHPGEPVEPSLPASLPPLPEGAPNNRLGFAQWVIDPNNPLTARVAVNHMWQLHFGEGLVRTTEDFGAQGERPSHPELLDWLAVEFVRSGWDVKAMHRKIVTSAAYRQSSKATPALLARDPENRLIARGPRLRLTAELLRDQALALSGLLVERLGGPSVKPYQPEGLWKEIATETEYKQSTGPDLYRRSLYSYVKRTVAAPTLTTFDAPSRESCIVRRPRTNTPLQALTLLNDVTFVEAARNFAERVLTSGGSSVEERIRYAFRAATARFPTDRELATLVAGHQARWEKLKDRASEAARLIAVGESKPDRALDPVELAAYTATCSLILNLDETVTRE